MCFISLSDWENSVSNTFTFISLSTVSELPNSHAALKPYTRIACLETTFFSSLVCMKNNPLSPFFFFLVLFKQQDHTCWACVPFVFFFGPRLFPFPLKYEQSIHCQVLKEKASPESAHLTPEQRWWTCHLECSIQKSSFPTVFDSFKISWCYTVFKKRKLLLTLCLLFRFP